MYEEATVCVLVYLCVPQREIRTKSLCVCKGERERETNREIEKDTVYVCV